MLLRSLPVWLRWSLLVVAARRPSAPCLSPINIFQLNWETNLYKTAFRNQQWRSNLFRIMWKVACLSLDGGAGRGAGGAGGACYDERQCCLGMWLNGRKRNGDKVFFPVFNSVDKCLLEYPFRFRLHVPQSVESKGAVWCIVGIVLETVQLNSFHNCHETWSALDVGFIAWTEMCFTLYR